jgi:hypothetical protein
MLRNYRSIAIDNDRPTVVVSISVVIVILPDNDRFATMAVPIPIVFTVTVTIPITMDLADGHTIVAYTDSDLFRSGGNCAADTHDGGQCDCVFDHCVLLQM